MKLCQSLPIFCNSSPQVVELSLFLFLLFPPFPLRKAELVHPPPGGTKTTPPPSPGKIWLIPLPVADPTPTYDQHDQLFTLRLEFFLKGWKEYASHAHIRYSRRFLLLLFFFFCLPYYNIDFFFAFVIAPV